MAGALLVEPGAWLDHVVPMSQPKNTTSKRILTILNTTFLLFMFPSFLLHQHVFVDRLWYKANRSYEEQT